jgi:hypothetical protein
LTVQAKNILKLINTRICIGVVRQERLKRIREVAGKRAATLINIGIEGVQTSIDSSGLVSSGGLLIPGPENIK